MSVEVSVQDDSGIVNVAVSGRFDFNLHQEFREAYERHGTPKSKFVLDLGGAEYMDSSALGMLLVMREYCGGTSADIEIQNCSVEIRKLLEIANYQKLFRINEGVH